MPSTRLMRPLATIPTNSRYPRSVIPNMERFWDYSLCNHFKRVDCVHNFSAVLKWQLCRAWSVARRPNTWYVLMLLYCRLQLRYSRETARRMLGDFQRVGHFEAKFSVGLRFAPISVDRQMGELLYNLPLEVFTQRNLVADFIRLKLNVIFKK